MNTEEATLNKSLLSGPLLSGDGREAGTVDLNPSVFGVVPNVSAVYETVRWQRARRRAGTHSVLTRSNMKGGGKKPFRQKGTGNARAGSNTSPLWVGGAVVHGPTPRSYDYALPKRTRRTALASILSDRLASGRIHFVDSLTVKEGKTKEFLSILEKLSLSDKSIFLIVPTRARFDENMNLVERAARNISSVTIIEVGGVNVYDLMKHQAVVILREAVSELESRIIGA